MEGQAGAQARSCAAAVFAVLVIVVGGLTLWCVEYPGSPAAAVFGPALRIADVPAARAQRALQATPGHPSDTNAARAATLEELRIGGDRPKAWLRLARLNVIQRFMLGKDGADALERSYRLAPFDFDSQDGAWRALFGFNQWAEISPWTRRAVVEELDALYSADGANQLLNTLDSYAFPGPGQDRLVAELAMLREGYRVSRYRDVIPWRRRADEPATRPPPLSRPIQPGPGR